MKNSFSFIIIIVLFCLIQMNCEKDNEPLVNTKGYIVGFDPCTINNHYRIGYIIITDDLKDTLVSYNLSDYTFKMPASVFLNPKDTVYKIPETLFENYMNSPFFSDLSRYQYPIDFSYSFSREDEMIYNLCSTDIVFLNFPQVIFHSITK